MKPAIVWKLRQRISAIRRELDELERAIDQSDGAARVVRKAKKRKAVKAKPKKKAKLKRVRKPAAKKAARKPASARTKAKRNAPVKKAQPARRVTRRAKADQLDLEHDFINPGRANGAATQRSGRSRYARAPGA